MSLAIGVRYLMGWSMAADQTRERPEWPPHPDRVFMALAAAYFEGDGPDAERAALEWLEGLPAPGIAAGEAYERTAVTSYVPVNDPEVARTKGSAELARKLEGIGTLKAAKGAGLTLLPEFRTRQARVFPVVIPESARVTGDGSAAGVIDDDGMPRVYLIWEGVEVDRSNRSELAALRSLCERVTSLGHSASLVQMWVDEGSFEPDWLPDPGDWAAGRGAAPMRIRVTGPGRLADLEEAFGEGARRDYAETLKRLAAQAEPLKGQAKKDAQKRLKELGELGEPDRQRPIPRWTAGYRRRTEIKASHRLERSHFDTALLAFARDQGPRLGLESVPALVRAFRGMVQAACDPAPAWLSGHDASGSPIDGPHAAVLPMAFVGHPHATGEVMGMALVLPGSEQLSREDRRCLGGLWDFIRRGGEASPHLQMGGLGAWRLRAVEPDDPHLTLRASTWTARTTGAEPEGARVWATVTPIVFDRHPRETWTRADPPRVRANRQAEYWEEVESMIKLACVRIGLPEPAEVIARADSGLIGVPRSDRFARMTRKDGSPLRHTHATIDFGQPVLGPVLVGAGRHKGYGVCRPVWDEAAGRTGVKP